MLSYIMPGMYCFIALRSRHLEKIRQEFISGSWKLPLMSLVSVLGYYSLLSTFRLAEASVAVPIAFTSTILTALGGIVILKERSNVLSKLAGAVSVVIGVILLR